MDQFRRIQTVKKGDIHIVLFKDKKILDDSVLDEIKVEINKLMGNASGLDMLLDFSNIEFMSSAMLGLLGQLHRKVGTGKGRLKMAGDLPGFQADKPRQAIQDSPRCPRRTGRI